MAEDRRLENLAHSIMLAYELIDRVKAGKETKALMSSLTIGRPSVGPSYERFAKLQDDYAKEFVVGDEKYKDALSILETEFGHIDSVKGILEKVYSECPALRPKVIE